jgi:tight adherence protein B
MSTNSIMVIMLAIVSTAVLSVIQGVYWTWMASRDRKRTELLRRLGNTSPEDIAESLFQDDEDDSAAVALGSFGSNIQDILMQAGSSMSVGALMTQIGIGAVVGMICGFLVMGLPGLVIALPVGGSPVFLAKLKGASRAKALIAQLPDSLDLMSRSLQAGLGLNDAFRLVAQEMPMPIQGEFLRVYEEVRFGRDYRDVLTRMLERNPAVFDLRLMVSSILLQRETGGNLIEILENISATVRARFVFQAKVKAMTSEAKMTAVILGALPLTRTPTSRCKT